MINKDILGKIPEKPYKTVYFKQTQDPDAPLPQNTAGHKAKISTKDVQYSKKAIFYKAQMPRATFAVFVLLAIVFPPYFANASILSKVGDFLNPAPRDAEASGSNIENSQTVALLEATPMIDPMGATSDDAVTIDSETALVSEMGPLGTAADVDEAPATDEISLYVVKKGDTIGSIAKLFQVTSNTIRWANDLKIGDSVKEGDVLTILPVAGVEHLVKKGDTLKSIAKKYGADIDSIGSFNGITVETTLAVGDTIIVPDGEIAPVVIATPKKVIPKVTSSAVGPLMSRATSSLPVYEGFFIRPISGGRQSQYKHDGSAIDLAVAKGTPIMAAAAGTVTIADGSGYNGGFGLYVVISHVAPDGRKIQTLYAHMSKVNVVAGQQVSQGDIIGLVGSTGHSTGPHVHFEVRGAWNPGFTRGVWD